MATTMNNSSRITWTYNDTFNYLSCDIFNNSIGTDQLTGDGVTYAKIQNVTDNRLLGRSAGSAGDVQELTVGAGLTLTGGVLSATTNYEEGTFTATATGMTAAVTGTARYVRVGTQVTVSLPLLEGTSNATTFEITGLPAGLTCGGGTRLVTLMNHNGTFIYGMLLLSGTTFTLYTSASFAGWTASGAKGLYEVHLTYLTA
jgi:hypothetical protein